MAELPQDCPGPVGPANIATWEGMMLDVQAELSHRKARTKHCSCNKWTSVRLSGGFPGLHNKLLSLTVAELHSSSSTNNPANLAEEDIELAVWNLRRKTDDLSDGGEITE